MSNDGLVSDLPGNSSEPQMPSSTPEQVTRECVPQNDTTVQESPTETSHGSSPALVTD